MKPLDRKLLRDLKEMTGRAVAIGLVMGCGIAVYVMAMTTLRTMASAKETYWEENRFAELFVSLVRAPNGVSEQIREIDGVEAADDRVVEAMTLDMPGMAEPATGQAISLPEIPGAGLNLIYLREGRLPRADREGEVLVSESFARAHNLEPGAQLDATIRGRKKVFTMVGTALSPEYLYQVQPGSLFPDDRRFGVFWMPRRQLEAASSREGAFNDLTLLITRDAVEEEVIRKVDRVLAPYGGGGVYTRENHQSARFIEDEIKSLRTMGMIPPLIFLGVAAFLLNLSLRRMLTQQREQVAALKAFGYTNFELTAHYGKLVVAIVIPGTIAGCILGTWMATGMVSMYKGFYHFPEAKFLPDYRVYLAAFGLALAAGATGVFGGVRSTVKLPPAEAMRPEPPASYRTSIFERAGLRHFLSQPARIVVREISRRPIKAMLTSLGIALSCAILIVGNFGKDSIDHLVAFQFGIAERDDARVQFVEARPYRALRELESVGGVMRAEPFRSVSVRIRKGPRSKRLGITGLSEDSQLNRLLDRDEQLIPLGGSGIVVSTVLADKLALKVGDRVRVEVLEGERPVREVKVTGLVADFAGTAAYMNLYALNRLLGEGRSISGAYLQLDGSRTDSVFTALKDRPAVASVSLKRAAIQSFMETFAKNILQLRMFNIIFASVIAVGVVYSSARISFSERGRDMATLRVIGLTRGEVSSILLGELGVLTFFAIPVGLAIGFGLCLLMSQALQTELYRIPFVIRPATYGFAAAMILVSSVVSGWIVRRKINKLDMMDALKSSE